MTILGVCGSLQRQSANLRLLEPPRRRSARCRARHVRWPWSLPHFNPEIEAAGVPESVMRWRRALAESDAVLIASPEYGFSLPGALKNAIDWVIGSGELEGKVVAITAAVPSPERGRRGLHALRDTLAAVRATIVGGEPIARGPEFDRQVAEVLKALIAAVAPVGRSCDTVPE